MRKELDSNTVKCMAPYIDKIFKWYLQEDDISLDGKSLGSFSNTASIKFRDGYINSIEKEVCYMFHNDRRRLIGIMKFSESNPRVSLQLKSKFDEIIFTEVLENEIEKKILNSGWYKVCVNSAYTGDIYDIYIAAYK